jgi:hypothetical protein
MLLCYRHYNFVLIGRVKKCQHYKNVSFCLFKSIVIEILYFGTAPKHLFNVLMKLICIFCIIKRTMLKLT